MWVHRVQRVHVMVTDWSGWKSTFVGQEIYAAFLTVPLIYCDTLRSHFTELSFYPGFYTEGNCSTTNSGIFCRVSL